MDKIHCVWIADGEMNVLFEKNSDLKAARIEFVRNKQMVLDYLSKTEYIPHIQTVITLEPTAGLETTPTFQQ